MQLSQSTEYAIHSLYYLALVGKDKLILVSEVAKAQNISESYLAKVFQALAKAGLIKSYRGAKGGYVLAQDPDQITFRKIVQVMEGSSPIFICDNHKRNCSFLGDCIISQVMSEAENKMYQVLEQTTLADIMKKFNRNTISGQTDKDHPPVPFWGQNVSKDKKPKRKGN
jgi:Rrf2 family protein